MAANARIDASGSPGLVLLILLAASGLLPPGTLVAQVNAPVRPIPPIQLTFPASQERPNAGIDWSPDGDWIVYGMWFPPAPFQQLLKVPAAGGMPVPIASGPKFSQAHWSKDGASITFLFMDTGPGLPAMVPVSGGPVQVLSNNWGDFPAPSINGKRLYWQPWVAVVVAGLNVILNPQLRSRRELVLIPPARGQLPLPPVVPPDGQSVAYNLDTRGLYSFTPYGVVPLFPPGSQCYAGDWDWSPTGERIAFISLAGCFGNRWATTVRWMRPFTDISYLLNSSWIYPPIRWSPCGNYILTHERARYFMHVVVIEVPSGRQTTIARDNALGDGLVWSPFGDEVAWVGFPTYPPDRSAIYKAPTGLPPTPALVGTREPGTTIWVRLKDAASPGRPYVLGASFGSDRGIQTPRGTIPLNLDPLLLLSSSGAPGFRNFQGTLDSAGRAEAYLDLPPLQELVGSRFFLGYVTLDPRQPGGIGTISGSVPFFVQPLW